MQYCHILFRLSDTSNCSLSCGCDLSASQPVCGSNGADYFSPCHAGCTTRNGTDQVKTRRCSQITSFRNVCKMKLL